MAAFGQPHGEIVGRIDPQVWLPFLGEPIRAAGPEERGIDLSALGIELRDDRNVIRLDPCLARTRNRGNGSATQPV